VSDNFHIEVLPNGLTLLGRVMDDVSSVAMAMLVRCGSADDPPAIAGAGAVAAEWLQRGAGQRDSRALNDALDSLGVQHSTNAQSEHMQITAAMLGRNLPAAIEIYADILTKPRLEDNTFGPCRELIQQDLIALEDEPARKAGMALRERFFPQPWGRCPYGRGETLEAMTADALREHVVSHLSPDGGILALAGKFDWDAVRDMLTNRLGDWQGQARTEPAAARPAGGAGHIAKDSAQTHIAQQTLDVTVGEIARLGEGISDDELTRAKTQIRSSLIMQSQSTSARASMMAGDWYHLGRLRSLAELSENIQAVTERDVMDYLREFPPRQFSISTIGPEPLDTTGLALSGEDA